MHTLTATQTDREHILQVTRGWLPRVSRSFAPSIALLGEEMEAAVGVAYLLCRILDTIEDSSLNADEKRALLHQFLSSIDNESELSDFLKNAQEFGVFEDDDDGQLLLASNNVLQALSGLKEGPRSIILACVYEMGEGMAELAGLQTIENEKELTHYCHIVAGTVGGFLTSLYLMTHTSTAEHKQTLQEEAEAFAQGLQRVNIAKDASKDNKRKVQFIPGLSIEKPGSIERHTRFCIGTLSYLDSALRYTLAIDPKSPYRCFCALPLMLAVHTLNRIGGHPEVFSVSNPPRIPREDTLKLIEFCRLHAGNDEALIEQYQTASADLRARQ